MIRVSVGLKSEVLTNFEILSVAVHIVWRWWWNLKLGLFELKLSHVDSSDDSNGDPLSNGARFCAR